MPAGPIVDGKDFNYFNKVTVSAANFGTNADVVINFRGQVGFSMMNESNGVVEYSFNGNTLHGDIDSSKDSKTLKFDSRRITKIWFRLKSGGPCVIRVEAWAAL